jgi:AraC-like DNA-binding protein
MQSNRYPNLEQICLAAAAEWRVSPMTWCIVQVSEGVIYCFNREQPCELAVGEVVIVDPGTSVMFRASQLGSAKLHYFYFNPDLLNQLLTSSERHDFVALAEKPKTGLRYIRPLEAGAKEFARISQIHLERKPFLERSHLLAVAATLFSPYLTSLKPKFGLAPNAAMARFLELMHTMPESEILHHSPSTLARYCGCHRGHLSRMCREYYGVPLRTKQSQLRWEKARRLIIETEADFTYVAFECGYSNVRVFNATFKRQMGMTPSKWRKDARPRTIGRNGSTECRNGEAISERQKTADTRSIIDG